MATDSYGFRRQQGLDHVVVQGTSPKQPVVLAGDAFACMPHRHDRGDRHLNEACHATTLPPDAFSTVGPMRPPCLNDVASTAVAAGGWGREGEGPVSTIDAGRTRASGAGWTGG